MCSASAVRISPWIERWCCLAMCRKASSISTEIRMENDLVGAWSCVFIRLVYTQIRRMSSVSLPPPAANKERLFYPHASKGRGFTRRRDKTLYAYFPGSSPMSYCGRAFNRLPHITNTSPSDKVGNHHRHLLESRLWPWHPCPPSHEHPHIAHKKRLDGLGSSHIATHPAHQGTLYSSNNKIPSYS